MRKHMVTIIQVVLLFLVLFGVGWYVCWVPQPVPPYLQHQNESKPNPLLPILPAGTTIETYVGPVVSLDLDRQTFILRPCLQTGSIFLHCPGQLLGDLEPLTVSFFGATNYYISDGIHPLQQWPRDESDPTTLGYPPLNSLSPSGIVQVKGFLSGGNFVARDIVYSEARPWAGRVDSMTGSGHRVLTMIDRHGDTIIAEASNETIILDAVGQPLSWEAISGKNTVVSVWGVTTQDRTGKWGTTEVRLPAQVIMVLGEASGLGEKRSQVQGDNYGQYPCKEGLNEIWMRDSSGYPHDICSDCGDGQCGSPEKAGTCPWDCEKTGEKVEYDVFVDPSSIDAEKGTCVGKLHPLLPTIRFEMSRSLVLELQAGLKNRPDYPLARLKGSVVAVGKDSLIVRVEDVMFQPLQ